MLHLCPEIQIGFEGVWREGYFLYALFIWLSGSILLATSVEWEVGADGPFHPLHSAVGSVLLNVTLLDPGLTAAPEAELCHKLRPEEF